MTVAAQKPTHRAMTKTAAAIEDDQEPPAKFLKTVYS
jgi:hypothetical protein